VYVIPKTLMRRFLSAKSQVFREWGCQFEDSHLATMPLSSPKQLIGIGERERATVDTTRGRARMVLSVVRILAEVAI